ncbi:MAG: hypothetical protein IMZ57_11020 [Acidobacteria bacterium]|nr:hypothetical protein [Acidobacteriota bacterium]
MRLKETELYLGDNGRCFCGRSKCAGSTAFYTNRDLSGQKVEELRIADVLSTGLDPKVFKCETCGQALLKKSKTAESPKDSADLKPEEV